MRDGPHPQAGPEELEREIERLPEVRAARVVSSPAGRILEIHLVSDGSKPPKQLTRDVETVAATRGLDIDRRTISIAQMPVGAEPIGPSAPGIALTSVAITTEAGQATCRVRVTRNDEDAIGDATAPATSSGRTRLVARATMDAVSHLTGPQQAAECDNALVVDVGEHRIAVAVVVFVSDDGEQDVVAGVHPARNDPDDAIARAVLDAHNRRA